MNRVELQVVSNVLGSQCPRAGACLLRAVERAAHAGANASRKRTRRLPSTGWHSLSWISSLRQSRRSSTRKSMHHTGRKGGRRLVVAMSTLISRQRGHQALCERHTGAVATDLLKVTKMSAARVMTDSALGCQKEKHARVACRCLRRARKSWMRRSWESRRRRPRRSGRRMYRPRKKLICWKGGKRRASSRSCWRPLNIRFDHSTPRRCYGPASTLHVPLATVTTVRHDNPAEGTPRQNCYFDGCG